MIRISVNTIDDKIKEQICLDLYNKFSTSVELEKFLNGKTKK